MRKSLLKLVCYMESFLSAPTTFAVMWVALSHEYRSLQAILGISGGYWATWLIRILLAAAVMIVLMGISLWLWEATIHYTRSCEGRESAKSCKQRLSVVTACSNVLCYLTMFVMVWSTIAGSGYHDIVMVALVVCTLVRLALMIGLGLLVSDLRRAEKDASTRRFRARYGASNF